MAASHVQFTLFDPCGIETDFGFRCCSEFGWGCQPSKLDTRVRFPSGASPEAVGSTPTAPARHGVIAQLGRNGLLARGRPRFESRSLHPRQASVSSRFG